MLKALSSLVVVLVLLTSQAAAQTTITGTITESDGAPLIGANVVVKGTSTGAVTDFDGKFNLAVPANATSLVVSYTGYETQEVEINGRTVIDIVLAADVVGLNEVTVTALGISREKKALGYAVQDVNGSAIDKAQDANFINTLAGKVAGVTIVGNPSGIGGSSRVSIRGERSLNINNNQPLYVVDGVPISNQIIGSSGRSNQEVDYGNGAGFVNPNDIETITVLKGASAAALYGSRANNGVIVITTKTGKNSKGIGVTVNTTMMFDDPLRLPEYQDVYGQGLNGQFEFKDGNGGGINDGVDESWGPAYQGQPIKQFNSPTANGFRGADVGNLNTQIGPVDLVKQLAARGDIQATPWVAQPDNVRDFFETGVTQSYNVAINGANEKSDFRLSYTLFDQTGIVPNTDLKRNTVSFAGGYNLTDRFKVRTVINYLKNVSGNRPNLSYGTENIMYLFNCWLGRSVNMASMRDYWQAGRVGLNQFGFNYNYHDNPYFNVYENTNSQDIDRIYGNFSLTYEFTDWMSLMLRAGTDASNEFRTRRRAYSTQRFPRGNYREEKIFLQETNADFLLSLTPKMQGALSVSGALGGNLMRREYDQSDVTAPELAVPGVYNLTNSRVALLQGNFQSEKRINSLYATSQLAFRNWLYLDLSGRNDWSSTLPSDNWSYFYYGANASAILTDALGITNNTLSFAKVRFGIGQVGNDTDPYQLQGIFGSTGLVQGQPSYGEQSSLPNPTLKPEISTSIETGVDLRFFRNRIGIDLTYYRTRSKNQILPIPLSGTTGYSSRLINAGLIQNQGVEVALNLAPIRTAGGFEWNINLNWSLNRSKVIELYTDPISGVPVTNYVMADRYITVEARPGEQMGAMYGIGFERVSSDPNSTYYDPTGQYVGQIVYNTAGKPVATNSRVLLGNYNPDWLAGLGNTITYKGLSLFVLFDVRSGGEIYSHTQTVGREGGQIIETLEGRANGYDLSQPGNGVIGEGVVKTGEGTFKPNDVKLSAREWHTSITLGRRLVEGMIYDASFAKLREVRLAYQLPNKLLGRLPIRDISLSVVGRNLALWTDVPHVDPETASTAGGTIIPGVESVALPSTRSVGFNLNFKF